MASVEILRRDCSVAQLRAEAARTADAKQARRILAIAMVLDGHARLLAAQACGMDRCATGLFATTRMGWPGWPTGHGLGARPLFRTGNGPRWRSGCNRRGGARALCRSA